MTVNVHGTSQTLIEDQQKRIEELTEDMDGWRRRDDYVTKQRDELQAQVKELQARLDYIGNPQNGSVDLAAYARGD